MCGNLKKKLAEYWYRWFEWFGRFWIKISFFESKWTFKRILRVSVQTFGIALFVYVCYLYAVLYSDQETSSESKHVFSHLLDGYHELIFGNFIILSFHANCVDLLCKIKSFCNKYKQRRCVLTYDFCWLILQKEEKREDVFFWKWDTKGGKIESGVCEIMWVCWIGVRCLV
jgi:hypothetical protein